MPSEYNLIFRIDRTDTESMDQIETPPHIKPRRTWPRTWWPLLTWMLAIYLVSDQPDIPHVPDGRMDWIIKKALHATAYGILAWLWQSALAKPDASAGRLSAPSSTSPETASPAIIGGALRQIQWWPWLLTVLYAATDEWHQTFVPGRHGQPYDIGIDALGALLALFWLRRRAAKHGDGGKWRGAA